MASIVYDSCNKVKKAVEGDDNAVTKVKAILDAGKKGTNNGQIGLLKAAHAHIEGGTAVAFKWKTDGNLLIVGYGVKGKGKRVSGDGGYDWTYCV